MFLKKIKFYPTSIRLRLTALFVVILAITLVGFCAILYQVFRQNHQREFDSALYNHSVDVAQSINVDFYGELVFNSDVFLNSEKIFPFALGNSFMQVLSPTGQIIARTANLKGHALPVYSEDWDSVFRNGSAFRTLPPDVLPALFKKSNYRLITYLAKRNDKTRFILQVAVPMSLLYQETNGLLIFFAFAIPLSLVIAWVGGLYLSGKALFPVRTIIEQTKNLNPSKLSERVPVSKNKDEMQNLAITLNELLERLENAFAIQERFVADASHQLKTPLAILRGELDVLRSRERSPEDIQEFLASASNELNHLSRMVEDLLLLARVEIGASSLSIQSVRLDELLLDAISRLEFLAKNKNITIRFNMNTSSAEAQENDFAVQGDADLLQSLFRNLIDNAIKYSPENSAIEVLLESTVNTICVSVSDEGTQIPQESQDKIFDRFYRANTANLQSSGSGLGLTIARRIAEAHRGSISLIQRNQKGKTFRVEIKKN